MDLFYLAIIVGITILLYFYVGFDFSSFFKSVLYGIGKISPATASFAAFMTVHTVAADFLGIAMFGFLSRLFFLPLPAEPYLLYAYGAGTNFFILIVVMSIAGIFASAFNYLIGTLFGNYFINKSDHAKKLSGRLQKSKFVSWLIFAVALLPLPDVAGVVFGASRVGFKKYLLWTFIGFLAKEVIVLLAFDYLSPLAKSFM